MFLRKCSRIPHFTYLGSVIQVSSSNRHFSTPINNQIFVNNSELILKTLNSSPEEDLKKLKLSKSRLSELLEFRKNGGFLEDINEVANFKGFTSKSVEQLYNQILRNNGEISDIEVYKVRGQILFPPAPDPIEINTAIGINITLNYITWAKIDRSSRTLVDWNIFDLSNIAAKKSHLVDLFTTAKELIDNLPSADIYILEAQPQISSSSQKQMMALLSQQKTLQLTCILLTLLNTNPEHNPQIENTEFKHRVHFLRHRLSARLFNTLIGSECVAANQIVTKILENDPSEDHYTKIQIPENLKREYEMYPGVEKEILGQALLLIMSFMDLCVYKNIESLKRLSGRKIENK